MPNIGPTELIIILLVVLLLFGSTRLPKLARSIGEASKEFKKGVSDGSKAEVTDAPPAVAPPADDRISMSRAELDALLASEREAEARRNSPPSSTS